MKRLPTLLSFLPLTFAAAMVLPAHAERAYRDQPMHIESDALRHDELQQTSVFTGNVVMTKGSIVLRGAQLDVRQDPQGYQYGVVTAASGKRAFFRQKRDTAPGAPEEFVEGEAEVIEYDGRKDDVRLIRRAQLRRYTGGKLSDDITGQQITYNNLTDVFTVDSQTPQAGNKPGSSSGGRVRAVLAPKAPPSASPAGTPAAGARLQATPQLTAPQEP